MAFPGTRFVTRVVACAAIAGLAAPSALSVSAHGSTATPTWLTNNAKTKTATLTITAGFKGGFDFNGYSKGQMTVNIPSGYHVNVVFSNNTAIPHSVVFTSYDKRMSS